MVEFLIDNGASVNLPNAAGETAVFFAIRNGSSFKLCRFDLFIRRCSSLCVIIENVNITNNLIKNGANISTTDRDGNTPMLISMIFGIRFNKFGDEEQIVPFADN